MEFLMNSGKLRGLHVMNTINALCLESLPEFLDKMMSWKQQYGKNFPNFTLNILRFPSFQSPLVLPDNLRYTFKSKLENWLLDNKHNEYLHPHELDHLRRLIDYLDVVKTPHNEAFEMDKLHNDFKQFYEQYDVRRNKNFINEFSKLAQWYKTL
jgi:hypothetical protein